MSLQVRIGPNNNNSNNNNNNIIIIVTIIISDGLSKIPVSR